MGKPSSDSKKELQAETAKLTREERDFLHALATPLGTMTLMLDGLLLKHENATDPQTVAMREKLTKLRVQLQSVNDKLKARREHLIQRTASDDLPG